MTITIELDPATEARLKAVADQRGVAPEEFAGKFLRDNLPFTADSGVMKQQDLEAFTREYTRGSENLPVLPPEANSRGYYYEGL